MYIIIIYTPIIASVIADLKY